MTEPEYAAHSHWPLLVAAYRQFRAGEHRGALNLLTPTLEGDESARVPSTVTGVLWGLAGDCWFLVGEPERGFAAYRQSMLLDPAAGCLTLFARQVACHRRSADAELALRCLDAAWAADRAAFRKHPIHVMRWNLNPDALYFRLVVLPLVRWRLRRLVAAGGGERG